MLAQLQSGRASPSRSCASPSACPPARRGTSARGFGTIEIVAERSTIHRQNQAASGSRRLQTGEIVNVAHASAGEVDDSALARAGMLGQEWAQRQIWYRFAPMVYALLRRSLGARHDTEDLVQEVFLRVFGRLSTLENPTALRSFIYSFAVRVVSEELRRRRVRSRLAAMFLVPSQEHSTPHVDFESRELLGRIQGVMDAMNDRVRTVFVLRRFDGLPLADIATSLRLSLATVKRDLDKANAFILQAIRRDGRLRAGLAAEADATGAGDES